MVYLPSMVPWNLTRIYCKIYVHFGFPLTTCPANARLGNALIFALSKEVGGRMDVNIENTRPPPAALQGRFGLE